MREKAFEELVKIGEPTALALRNALKKWTVREGAAEALKAVNEKTKETKAKNAAFKSFEREGADEIETA